MTFYVNQLQAASLLGVSTANLWRWERAGFIDKPKKIGFKRLYDYVGLLQQVKKHRLSISPNAARFES